MVFINGRRLANLFISYSILRLTYVTPTNIIDHCFIVMINFFNLQFSLDIEGFLQQKHKIKRQPVDISLHKPLSSNKNSCHQQDEKTSITSQPDDIIPDTIEVTGEDISNAEVLELYFQGVTSGGKREKEVEWINCVDDGVVHVKFLSSKGERCSYKIVNLKCKEHNNNGIAIDK